MLLRCAPRLQNQSNACVRARTGQCTQAVDRHAAPHQVQERNALPCVQDQKLPQHHGLGAARAGEQVAGRCVAGEPAEGGLMSRSLEGVLQGSQLKAVGEQVAGRGAAGEPAKGGCRKGVVAGSLLNAAGGGC
eukprot:366317-Chlamydomonas_euryale.AAC.1